MTPHVSHVEWFVSDLDRAVEFYHGLFGWRFESWSRHYRLYTPASGCCVGLMEVAERFPADSPMVHVQVDDLRMLSDLRLSCCAKPDIGPVSLSFLSDGYGYLPRPIGKSVSIPTSLATDAQVRQHPSAGAGTGRTDPHGSDSDPGLWMLRPGAGP